MSKRHQISCAAIAGAIFLFSFAFWIFNTPKQRYVFLFESFDSGKTCMEERYLPFENSENAIQNFTDELLLGSRNSRYRPLFSPETKALFCFFQGKTLFINFSSDIINGDSGSSNINVGFELYRKNILHNFKNIKNIKMFADSHELL